ncbi:MAG: DMT family transporter [Proteobacteria bacterium]|nr:DMT family transporter [Pseudomonadota bacterium]
MSLLGVIVGLSTAISWSGCALFFTAASKRVGVMSMNHYRTLFGTLLIAAAHAILFGSLVPDATRSQAGTLVASGLVGVVLGDIFLFNSYVDIGPRLGLLIFNINPFVTAFLARGFLGERLSERAWLGMTVTIAGTLWVLWEEKGQGRISRSRHHVRGLAFAALAACCQAVGFVIAKPAITGVGAIDPLSATFIRVSAALVGFFAIGMATGQTAKVIADFRHKKAMLQTLGGAVAGPFIGIWLSLTALKLLPAGVAATLIATMPVVILPMVMVVHKERVSWKATVGAVVAVLGVAILFNA